MKLSCIAASNLKEGPPFKHRLTNSVAVIGPNFSGKTRILEAIRLLFKGYIPEIGKKPEATWELSSADEMAVTGTFDNGAAFSRYFFLEKGTAKQSFALGGEDLLTVPGTELIELFAKMPLLDAGHYFDLTDRERVDYVFSMVTLPDKYTGAAIIAQLERISFEEAHTEVIETAKASVIKWVRDRVCSGVAVGILQNVLTAAVDELKEKFTYWNRRAKDTTGAVATITELKLQENETAGETVEDLDALIETAQKTSTEAGAELLALATKVADAKTAQERRKAVEIKLAAEVPDFEARISAHNDQITVLQGKIVAVDAAALQSAKNKLAEVMTEQGQTGQKLTQARTNLADAEAEKIGMASLDACPVCKSDAKDWKRAWKKNLVERIATAKKDIEDAGVKAGELRDQAAELEGQVTAIFATENANGKIVAQVGDIQHSINKLLWQKESSEKERAAMQEQLNAETPEMPTTEQIDAAATKAHEAQNVLKGLVLRRDTAKKLAHDLQRAAQAELEHLSAKAYVDVIKAVQKALGGIREEMVAEVFTGLLATSEKILGTILKSPLAFHEGTVGRWAGTKFVTHRTFSGTEKALTYVAIAAALSTQSPIRLVILDEFDRLDDDNKRKLIIALHDAVQQRVIDQFILVGTQALPNFFDQPEYLVDVISTNAIE